MDESLKGSERRLWQLVAQRCEPGSDKTAIDERIWDLFGEQWAVMFTDLAGFGRQTASFGITHFLQVIYEQRRVFLPIVHDHDGILIKAEADSFMILFRRASRALDCAVAMQDASFELNASRSEDEQLLLCVGIGFGHVLRIGDSDVWGREVNAASKLGEDIARSGEILLTAAARDAIGEHRRARFADAELSVPGSERNYRAQYQG